MGQNDHLQGGQYNLLPRQYQCILERDEQHSYTGNRLCILDKLRRESGGFDFNTLHIPTSSIDNSKIEELPIIRNACGTRDASHIALGKIMLTGLPDLQLILITQLCS